MPSHTPAEKAKRARRKKAPGTASGKVQLSRPDNTFGISVSTQRMSRTRTIRTTARIQKGLKSKKKRSV